MRAYAAGALARTLFFTAPAARRRRRWRSRPPPRRRPSWSTSARRCAPRSSRRRATGWAASRARRISRRSRIEGDGPGAKMLAAMVSFGLAMTGASAERSAALAERALADDVLIGVDPALFPVPALMVLTMADREEAVAGWEKLLAPRAPPRLAARRAEREPVERAHAAVARRAARGAGDAAGGANERFAEWGLHALARDLRTRVPRGAVRAAARRPRRRARAARGGPADDDGSDGYASAGRARAELLLEEGRPRRGARRTGSSSRTRRARRIPGWLPWRSLRALRARGARPGRRGAVRSRARRSTSPAASARRGVVGRSLRVLGDGATPTHGVAHLREAVELLERSTARYELAPPAPRSAPRSGSTAARPTRASRSAARSSSPSAAAPTGSCSGSAASSTRRGRGRAHGALGARRRSRRASGASPSSRRPAGPTRRSRRRCTSRSRRSRSTSRAATRSSGSGRAASSRWR